MFRDSSSFASNVWYNENTKTDVVGESDAAEISADNPTDFLVTGHIQRKEEK